MIDATAIAWKEWRELLGQRGLRGKFGMLLFVAVFGVAMPWQNGPRWITSSTSAIAWAWAPMFLVTTVIADAIAGERERHTLETLLASRLSDHAILFGKIGAAIGYAGVVAAASLVTGLVTVNVLHPRSGILLYPLPTVLAMGGVGLLGALFVAAVGVLISLRAATVRQAQQTLGGAVMVLVLIPVGLVRLLPAEWTTRLAAASTAALVLLGLAALAALDAAVVGLAMVRFRRARLIAS